MSQSPQILVIVAMLGLTGCTGSGVVETPSDASFGAKAEQIADQHKVSVDGFAEGAPAGIQQFLRNLDALYNEDPALLAGRLRSTALAVQSASLANPIRPDVNLVGQSFGDETVNLQVRQPLIDFGKRIAQVAQLDARRAVTEQDLDNVRHALLSEALGTIEVARFAKERIALHRRQIADYAEARTAAQNLVDLNLASASELRLAEVEQQRAQIDLAVAQQDLADAALIWKQLFDGAKIPTEVAPNLLRETTGIAGLERALDVAATSSLPVRNLEVQHRLLVADRALEERNRWPTIGAGVNVDLLDLGNDPVSVGLTLDVPIYRRGQGEALNQLDAAVFANTAETIAQKRDIKIIIQRAQQRANASQALAQSQGGTQNLLRQRVDDANLQVRNGLAKYTDVIEARVEVFDTELEALTSRHEARLADIEIILATGILVPQSPQ